MTKPSILFFILFILFSIGASAQDTHYMGVRIGDPIGITYKKFVRSDRAFEFILGTSSPRWRKNYYENSFYHYTIYDGNSYQSHKVKSSMSLQGRYLFHNTIQAEGMEGKLQWYAGAGAMLKYSRIQYKYYDNTPDNTLLSNVRTNIDFGPEAIGGVEYYFEDIPLAVFGEMSVLFEMADKPLTVQILGGIGVRLGF